MKICSCCKEQKIEAEFNICARAKDGLQKYCRVCQKVKKNAYYLENRGIACAYAIAYKKENRDKKAKHDATYRQKHSAEKSAKDKVYNELNADRIKIQRAAYRLNNLDKKSAAHIRRETRKINAYVSWVNEFFITEIYALAKLRTKLTGILWHVDHIVPLQSKLVCGLHCAANLQVIPAVHNLSKNNRYWPNMPEVNHG